ncbi:hypothetical protein CI109_103095 [Kwoniella shandongensis]|uniref:Uncharacterized protein n=1 Tax=Kwoniella shandongensis TaxID=1734106 RepID=A0A5M6CDC1_9TREE|nr:uncharacterized protein CI109_000286 [Kwoniella shandongensis]KAA5531445.1 hypothetical protein CI109_000286 [Kwoniella shandongensis]
MSNLTPSSEAGPSRLSTYRIGNRYLHAKNRQPLTLKYIGSLPPLSSTSTVPTNNDERSAQLWLGVEYDDPAYGKGHSGEYKGIQVFQTREKGSGAFLKYVGKPLVEGKTLVESIEERYGRIDPSRVVKSTDSNGPSCDDNREASSSNSNEGTSKGGQVVLGSSSGAIVVEAPNIGDVRERVAKLEKLRNMGFEDESITSLGGSQEVREVLRTRLKGLKWLNLSRNLIYDWDDVLEIVEHLEGLEILTLSHSRFNTLPEVLTHSPESKERYTRAFARIKELHLSDCLVTWQEVCRLGTLFPNVEILHLEANRALITLDSELEGWSSVKELKLGGCPMSDWDEVVRALGHLERLENLDLSSTNMESIPKPPTSTVELSHFPRLQSLALLNSRISKWTDIDNLSKYLPRITSLRFSLHPNISSANYEDESPLPPSSVTISGHPRLDRSIFIAKFPTLTIFNSTPITVTERRDAELFYISYVAKYIAEHGAPTADRAVGEWGRYEELCKLHGREIISKEEKTTKDKSGLRGKMITLHIYMVQNTNSEMATLSLLPSSSISLLQRKVARVVGVKPSESASIGLWTVRTGREKAVNILEEGGHGEVGWWFSDGDEVIVELDN